MSVKRKVKKVLRISLTTILIVIAVGLSCVGIKHVYDEGIFFGENPVCLSEETLVTSNNVENTYALVSKAGKNRERLYIFKDKTCKEFNAEQDSIWPVETYKKVITALGVIAISIDCMALLIFLCVGFIWLLDTYIEQPIKRWINNGPNNKKFSCMDE